MDKRKEKKLKLEWKYLFFVCFLCFAAFILIYVWKLPHREAKFDNETCTLVTDEWEYISKDGEVQNLQLPMKVEPNKGENVVISHILPTHYEDTINTFAIWTGMRFIDAYLDGNLIYRHENTTEYGKVEGGGWLIVRLPDNWQGKKLTIEISSPYPEYVGSIKTIFLGTKASILFELIEREGANLIIAILLIAVGVLLNIFYLFFHRILNGDRSISYLGWFQILTGIWLFTESALTQLFFNNTLIVDTLTYVSLATLPIPMLLYLLENKPSKRDGILHGLIALHTLYCIAILLLQTFQIKTMYEMIPLSHVLLVVSGIVILAVTFWDIFINKKKALLFLGYGSLILFVSGMMEFYFYYQGERLLVGTFFRVAIIICMIMITVVAVRKAFSVVRVSSEAIYYEKLALLDFMTQCQNRTSYQKELEKQEKRIFEKENITMVVADLNNLKKMNDTLGHHIGDAAIKLCGKMILQVFRELGTCYRVGGDEFACIIYNCKEKAVQDKIREFKVLCEEENKEWEYEFRVAIGYAVYNRKLDGCLEDTMKRADKQMYGDKKRSKEADYVVGES